MWHSFVMFVLRSVPLTRKGEKRQTIEIEGDEGVRPVGRVSRSRVHPPATEGRLEC